jgi:thiamine-monophosphate kinase
MQLKEIGEFGFIERFKPWFGDLLGSDITGIGDDCAILPMNDEEELVVTTDLLMENIHFLRDAITPNQLGYKSLAVNLSDIAAMGATPIGSFLSIAIPKEIEVEFLDAFMLGYREISAKYATPLLGGDTTKSAKDLAINVCVIGKCKKGTARRRSMAQIGDIIYVTGNLGDSAAGLQLILNAADKSTDAQYLIDTHHQPEPRINEGQFLATQHAVHAMMDISDGIASDLHHILKASGKSAEINLDFLPHSDAFTKIVDKYNWNAHELAVAGGEDYELLFTADKECSDQLQSNFEKQFGKPLFPIGIITEGAGMITWQSNGKPVSIEKIGFNHFL